MTVFLCGYFYIKERVVINLSELIDTCRDNYASLPYHNDINISGRFSELLNERIAELEENVYVEVFDYSLRIISRTGHRAELSSSALWYASTYAPLYNALEEYLVFLENIKRTLVSSHGYTTVEVREALRKLPSGAIDSAGGGIEADIVDIVNNQLNASDASLFKMFLSTGEWWFKPVTQTGAVAGKKLDRSDIRASCILSAAQLVADNSSKIVILIKVFASYSEVVEEFNKLVSERAVKYSDINEGFVLKEYTSNVGMRNEGGRNVIYSGAPGTGKSYKISQNIDEINSVRTVFHPDTQYSDFVGCLKPHMSEPNKVSYSFRPGPFATAIVKAINSPEVRVSLVIEELNRASAAAAFGEIFQLLDRDVKGRSVYTINISDPDFYGYLNRETHGAFNNGYIYIPSNLDILATMNSSDQAVMPLDTAFKRRWQFEYMPIDYDSASNGAMLIPVTDHGVVSLDWKYFSKIVNERLVFGKIPEDRLLGHRFVAELELQSDSEQAIKSKVLMYLWDDVLRHGKRDLLFKQSTGDLVLNSYGQLVKAYEEKLPIFIEAVEREILAITNFTSASSGQDE